MFECGICRGPLRLLHRGAGASPTSADLSPTCHAPGVYADLYRCEHCGTVRQAGMPGGKALVDLYRAMEDGSYLAEESGRRATARRLLTAIERHARRRGRMLDVGCGHGLLLDEARARGWTVLGLEPCIAARRHATEELGLEVLDATLEDMAAGANGGGFDSIVLADVLEHLDDPVADLDRVARLLVAGGVGCVVTPDPGSPTARAAGARWWGYLPAHTHLLPRQTLLDVLRGTGLEPVADSGLRRTFTLSTWAGGLAERGGALGSRVERLDRLPLMRMPLTLSLGDERVVVARASARPAPTGRFRRRRGTAAASHAR